MRYLIIIFTFWTSSVVAQEIVFEMHVSYDTVYMGNYVGVKFSLENGKGEFVPPTFEDFRIVSGPNISSQFSMINGEVSQSSSYEYILEPTNLGVFIVESGKISVDNQVYASDPAYLTILDNPEGIRQDYRYYNRSLQGAQKSIPAKPMTRADSIRQKLRKLKAKKF